MPKITFIEHDGTEHIVDVEPGGSVMQAAIDNLVPGIDADCGGECACATCHVMIADNWTETAGGPGEREDEMLDLTPERETTSRLSCQIKVRGDLDGLVVRMPEFQM